ncbi:MAG: hypothetical protein HFI89_11220 [Lachnospiraceae bacterium]|nr:hypothetical protein [Lachnospiraceae bacterium]
MEKPKLTSFDINIYALAQGALTMAFTVQVLYLTLFMTDYLGISPVLYGTCMLVAKTADFLISLIAGVIIEKSNMKHGKYVSWLRLLTGTLFFGMLIQMFDTTAFVHDPVQRAVIVCIGYIMFHGSMNFNATARGAIIPKMCGANMEDRKKVTTRQSQVGAAVSIIGSAIILPVITATGKVFGEAKGYFAATVLFSTFFLICNVIFVKRAGKFDPPGDPSARKRVPTVGEMVKSILTNKQMIILFCAFTLFTIGTQIYSGVTAYYFRVVTGRFEMMTIALTARSIVAFLASLCVPAIGRKFGKKGAMVIGFSLYAISTVGMWLLGLKSLWFVVVFMCTAQAAQYVYQSMTANYYLDCGEYGYYTSGQDNRTMALTVMNLPTKIGFAVGGSLVGYLLAWAGYSAGMEVTAQFVSRYMMVLGLFPALFMVAGALIAFFGYKLTDDQARFYAEANEAREKEEAAK